MAPLDRSANGGYSYSRRIGRLLLYLDDIEDVIAFLKEAGASTVVLHAGVGVAEDGPADLRSATRKEVRAIAIHASDLDLSVDLNYFGAVIATTNRRKAARALVDSVHRLLALRRKTFIAPSIIMVPALIFLGCLGASVPYYIAIAGDPREIAWQITVNGIFLLFGIVASSWLILKGFTSGYVVVVRQWRKDRLTLFGDMTKEVWKFLLPVAGAALVLLAKGILDAWSILWKR